MVHPKKVRASVIARERARIIRSGVRPSLAAKELDPARIDRLVARETERQALAFVERTIANAHAKKRARRDAADRALASRDPATLDDLDREIHGARALLARRVDRELRQAIGEPADRPAPRRFASPEGVELDLSALGGRHVE